MTVEFPVYLDTRVNGRSNAMVTSGAVCPRRPIVIRRVYGVGRGTLMVICSSEVFLISTALPTIVSDRYSVLTLRRTRVLSLSLAFVRCPCSLLALRHLNLFFL